MAGLGSVRRLVACGACCVALSPSGAAAVAPAKATTAWDRAVALRGSFDPATATRADWARVLDGFRAVYHSNPGEAHAPDAVNAVAELLAQQGRQSGDARLSRAAVGQYEFLRTQYPGSRLRVAALLAEGRIDAELGDPAGARAAYVGVVREAPGSASAATARGLLAGMAAAPASRGDGVPRPVRLGSAPGEGVPPQRSGSEAARAPDEQPGDVSGPATTALEAPRYDTGKAGRPDRPDRSAGMASGPLAEVTGIRHWSTPTYTRVAIDLGDEVKFEAARVPHPDRIYFDLHGARLAAELVGKSFDVTDDGFLRKIRAAQATGDITRVVLDVSDVTEYSAFLLPNPYRLIIDIHGKKRDGGSGSREQPASDVAEVPVPVGAGRAASAAANSSGLPAMATTDRGEAAQAPTAGGGKGPLLPQTMPRPNDERASGRSGPQDSVTVQRVAPEPRTGVVARATAARPVPNTVAVKAPATATEVAAVSAAPGRVEATSAPTSKPIVAVSKPVARTPVEARAHDDEAVVKVERPGSLPVPKGVTAAPGKAADRTAEGETSLVRALGLKIGRIVIDAGHGGHDSGTLGVDGIEEKDVVLDVALRLGKLLHERLGAEIIYTRSDDTFIPLETRTAIANKAQADLFLSIHANSSQDPTARGVETYYLNFTSDPTALDVAARENAVGGQGVHQLSDLVKKIALKDKIAESREFASDVEGSLYAGLENGNAGLKNRGVKKAPFVVLIGANMPSILAEISFVTNARDATQLREPEYRQRVAESLYNGVAKYEGGLAGTKPAPIVRAAVK